MHRAVVLYNFGCQIQNFVAMATSLEILSNEIEIPDPKNPTIEAKFFRYCHHFP